MACRICSITQRKPVALMSERVDERQPVQRDRKQQDEQQAGEEGRQREADKGERVGDLVEDRIGPRRGIDADRDRDRQRQQLRRADHIERRRQALQDQRVDVHPADKGKAPVAVQHRRDPVQVTQVDRIVEAELGPKRGGDFGRHVRIGREFTEGIAGRQRQHDEQHQRNAEQARHRDQETTQHILAHEGKIPSAISPSPPGTSRTDCRSRWPSR